MWHMYNNKQSIIISNAPLALINSYYQHTTILLLKLEITIITIITIHVLLINKRIF